MNFRRQITSRLDGQMHGVEFGPSFNPVAAKSAGFNVTVVDHMTRDGLVEKYRGHSDVDTSKIEAVDVVWDGGDLRAVLPLHAFDYIIASHVIEHMPNFLGFLKACEDLLRPGGVLYLLVPDKRYCFDHFRPVSSLGQVLDGYYGQRRRPAESQVFDHYAYASTKGGNIAWTFETAGPTFPVHSLEDALSYYRDAKDRGAYHDVHCWVFTPQVFRTLISDLGHLGLLELREVSFLDTIGSEFFAALSCPKGPARPGPGAGNPNIPRETGDPIAALDRDPSVVIASLRDELVQVQKSLLQVRASLSWRISAPIRWLSGRCPVLSAFARRILKRVRGDSGG